MLVSDFNFVINDQSWKFSFLGGLAEEVDEKTVQAAFIPFGDIIEIQMPLDYSTGYLD